MKTAGKILTLIILSLFILKCENSQGYDPYATITPILPEVPGLDTLGNSPDTEFAPDSSHFVFLETYRVRRGMGGGNTSVVWDSKNVRRVITLDTAGTVTKLFMKMYVKSSESRPYFRMRADWVNSFEISFGAVLDEEFYKLIGNSDSKRWFQIKIFRNIDNKIMAYGPAQTSGQVFINELNSDRGIISGTIVIDLTNVSGMKHHLQLQRFKSKFVIFY